MDLELLPRYVEFRDECRAWLADNRPAEPPASMDSAAGFEQHRLWEHTLFEGGWSVPAWPAVYGGRDCDLIEWLIYEEEYWLSGVPGRVSANGVSLLAPTIFNFGTKAQQDYFLPRMASGEQIWAQGWSEPEAGSDLAGIKTTAVLDGDDYVINGQKTWCFKGQVRRLDLLHSAYRPAGRTPCWSELPVGAGRCTGHDPPDDPAPRRRVGIRGDLLRRLQGER